MSRLGTINGEKIAIRQTATIIRSPITAGISRKNFLRISISDASLELFSHARIKPGVHDVDKDVDDRIDQADDQSHRKNRLVTPSKNPVHPIVPDPGPAEQPP